MVVGLRPIFCLAVGQAYPPLAEATHIFPRAASVFKASGQVECFSCFMSLCLFHQLEGTSWMGPGPPGHPPGLSPRGAYIRVIRYAEAENLWGIFGSLTATCAKGPKFPFHSVARVANADVGLTARQAVGESGFLVYA